ncbi:hypothetical protein ACLOJK_003186 [Asimina triloba]
MSTAYPDDRRPGFAQFTALTSTKCQNKPKSTRYGKDSSIKANSQKKGKQNNQALRNYSEVLESSDFQRIEEENSKRNRNLPVAAYDSGEFRSDRHESARNYRSLSPCENPMNPEEIGPRNLKKMKNQQSTGIWEARMILKRTTAKEERREGSSSSLSLLRLSDGFWQRRNFRSDRQASDVAKTDRPDPANADDGSQSPARAGCETGSHSFQYFKEL